MFLREARQLGVVTSRNGVFAGASMLTLPLPLPRLVRGRPLAVGVGAPSGRLDVKLKLVIDTSQRAIADA